MNEALEFIIFKNTSNAQYKRENVKVEYQFQSSSNTIVSVKFKTLGHIFNEFYSKKKFKMCRYKNCSILKEEFCNLYQLDGSICNKINNSSFSNLKVSFLNNSNVISKKVFYNNFPVSKPISIQFYYSKKKGFAEFCIFYNETTKLWSNEGCFYVSKGNSFDIVECRCSHTTIFAFLLIADTGYSEQAHPKDVGEKCRRIILVSFNSLKQVLVL